MRVFVAGAAGAIGQHLVPQLVAHGHEVTALTRSAHNGDRLRDLGATPVIADALDRADVAAAMRTARPEVVVHQLTSLTRVKSLRRFDHEFALTNRLRTQGTDNLIAGARAAGAGRFIAQSFGNWNYERTGSLIKTEDDPLDPNPPANQVKTLEAIRHVERATVSSGDLAGLALRYGGFYGPGSNMALDGDIAAMVRKRKFPIIGDGSGTVVVHPPARRCRGDRGGCRARRARRLQHLRRRAGGDSDVASRVRRSDRGQAAAARPGVARPARRRRSRGVDDDAHSRSIQRQGPAGAGLEAALCHLPRGLSHRPR